MEVKKYSYDYPHAALTVDCVIFGFDGESLKILLVERGLEPYKGMWALPGGFMKMDETVEEAAARELREETGLGDVYLQQFKVFSSVHRDPRERVVTVAFIALVRPKDCVPVAGDDASNALWYDEKFLPPMAFDHEEIIREARHYLSERLKVSPVAFNLLNKVFSLSELQRVYEAINDTCYDRRNFQRKALQSGLLEEQSDDRIECAACEPQAMPRPMIASVGRPARKMFSFKRLLGGKEKSDDRQEGSTKDLFDF